MAEPYDAPRRAEDIRACVFSNDIRRACELMLDFAGEFFGAEQADDVRIISMQLRELEAREHNGDLSIDEALPRRSKNVRNLLTLLRELLGQLGKGGVHA